MTAPPAAARPVHAYLVAGPRGSGAEDAARALAGELIGGPDPEGAAARVGRGVHPDVVEIEPAGSTYAVQEDIRDRVVVEAFRSPVEGDRKVLLLFEAERMRPEAANALLKTLEEPPPRSVLILVTGSPEELLDTVRSRCRRIDVPAPGRDAVVAALAPDPQAELVARLAGGRIDRARALAGPWRELRAAFAGVPARIDGTGARVLLLVDELGSALDAAAAGVRAGHEAEEAELLSELEGAGYPERTALAMRRRLARRHKREDRRVRADALAEGLSAVESVYRDVLAAPGPPLNTDRSPLPLGPAAGLDALDAVAAARAALELNPVENHLLERLLLHLPAPVGAGASNR